MATLCAHIANGNKPPPGAAQAGGVSGPKSSLGLMLKVLFLSQAGPLLVRGGARSCPPAGAAQAGRVRARLPVRAQPQPPVPHVRGHPEARRPLACAQARLRQVSACHAAPTSTLTTRCCQAGCP